MAAVEASDEVTLITETMKNRAEATKSQEIRGTLNPDSEIPRKKGSGGSPVVLNMTTRT